MWSRRSFRHLALAGALHALVGYGVGAFNAAFLMRSHGMGTGEIGTWLAGIGLVAGSFGTYYGGALADRLAPRDERWNVWVPALSLVAALPFSFGFYLFDNKYLALVSAIPPAVFGAMYLGPTFKTTQALAELRMRAVASAVLLFIMNLIGMGLGPVAVGIASDVLLRVGGLGDQSLRFALLLVTAVNVWATFHYLIAARTLRADLVAPSRG
jgi:MFS family permease